MKLFIVFARARFSPDSAPDNSSTYELSFKYFIVFSSFRIEGRKKILIHRSRSHIVTCVLLECLSLLWERLCT